MLLTFSSSIILISSLFSYLDLAYLPHSLF